MGQNGDVTGGELYKLWQAANVNLPRVANVYTDANGGIAGTSAGGSDSTAFTRPGTVGPGIEADVAGKVYASWAPLRDEFQLILSKTAQNIIDASEALNLAIQQYSETDNDAGAELDRIKNDPNLHDPDDPAANPPTGENAPGQPKPPENYTSPSDET